MASPLLVRAGGSSTHASLTTPGPFLHPLVTLNRLKAPTASARKIRHSSDPAYLWVIWWEKNCRQRGFGSPKRPVDAAEGGRGCEYGEGQPLPRRERPHSRLPGGSSLARRIEASLSPKWPILRYSREDEGASMPYFSHNATAAWSFVSSPPVAGHRAVVPVRLECGRSRRPNTRGAAGS